LIKHPLAHQSAFKMSGREATAWHQFCPIFSGRGHLAQFLPDDVYHLSIITEIELLSYSWLTEAIKRQIRSVLSEIIIVDSTDPSSDAAIDLRCRLERKISNAVIMVSAPALSAKLFTDAVGLLLIADIDAR
jgi:hypothetical protein